MIKMHRAFRGLRRLSGTTLTEVTISSALLIGMLSFGIPVFKSIGDAGDEGSSALTAQTENQQALLKIGGELQNSSTTATDAFNVPRLAIAVGTRPEPLRDVRVGAEPFGGFKGQLGTHDPFTGADPTSAGTGSLIHNDANATTDTNTSASFGSGDHSLTQFGRVREAARGTAGELGAVAQRPRFKDIPFNSELTFQKVVGYTVGADGAPEIQWGPPITYRVENRKLVRIQSGQTRAVAPFVIGFRAELSDSGTILLTLVSQKRANGTGRVTFQANQIEISPKN